MSSPPALRSVLAAVNEIRAKRGRDPLGELPPGTHSGMGCPLVQALEAQYVQKTKVRFADGPSIWFHEDYPILRDFIEAFDHLRPQPYPNLEVQ